ncbi:MAG: cupin domain-containing protein [Fimbriimonadales bacterium]|nr:cupin domain-containing protein [Fimbriimonadales bacterium]
MDQPRSFRFDLEAAGLTPPENGILSKTLFEDDRIRIFGFAFDAGQTLSEHTASVPAMIAIVSGRARVGLGDDGECEPRAGEWIYLQARLPHSVVAIEPTVMLLAMLR